MATAEVINSRREMKERTNAAMIRLSLLDCHSESHVSMNNNQTRLYSMVPYTSYIWRCIKFNSKFGGLSWNHK